MFKTNLAFSLLVVAFAKSGAQNSLLGSAQEHNLALTPCENDIECSHLQNATCKNKFCECLGTKFCADKIATVVNKIGEKCTDDGECNIGYSECQRGGCACSTGRVAPEDGRRCLTASKLNESCEDSVQCRSTDPRSECQNNECVCQQQMHEYDGVCYKNVGLGEHCNATGDCSLVQFSKCLVHCRCKNGYLRSDSGDKCLPVGKKISDPCSEDIQCSAELGAAICKDGHCGCMDSYQFQWKSNKCVRDKHLGDKCRNNSDCNEEGENRLECAMETCKCADHTTYIDDIGYCSSDSTKSGSVLINTMLFIAGCVIFNA